MKNLFLTFVLFLLVLNLNAQAVKVMLVTGGHSYDTVQFAQMFDSLDGINYKHFVQPNANREIEKGTAAKFDVLVFYDMWQEISEKEKKAYLELTKTGKPFLFLHHSIASYQSWPEFEQLLGGKYVEKNDDLPESDFSNYEHDVWVYSNVEQNHPVTSGFTELRFFDEIYGNVKMSDKVITLLKTNHPKSMKVIAWENSFNLSKIVYLQPGHDYRTYETEEYRKLLLQAIKYLANSN